MVWVSPSGNDANSGSSAQPLATLLAARNKVRTIIANGRPAGSIVVNVRSGRYQQSETLDFVEGDSGTPEAPVIWRAVDGPVWVTGSVAIPANAYQVPPAGMANLFPATIRSQIRMVDLAALGVSTPIESNDRDGWTATGASIVVDGTGLTLARYPNTGWLAVESGSTAGGATDPVVLSTSDTTVLSWAGATGDARLYAEIIYQWAAQIMPVTAIDASANTITAQPHTDWGWVRPTQLSADTISSICRKLWTQRMNTISTRQHPEHILCPGWPPQ